MRKIILFLFIVACFEAFAQKSYINVSAYGGALDTSNTNSGICLTGDVPSGMATYYSYNHNNSTTIGNILNQLSQKGYEVEFMSGEGSHMVYLLSKSSPGSSNVIQRIVSDDDEIKEVARYNLQGMPVNEKEKGVQIIVYSNYTTKTVIVE